MKIHPFMIAVLAAAPLAASAQVTVFNDIFSGGSTINSATPTPPTAISTSYEQVSAKGWSPNPSTITNGLTYGIGKTSGGGNEIQALFTTSPVQLIDPGDYITLTFTFTNVIGVMTQDTEFGAGMFNSGGSAPFGGGLNGNDESSSTPIVANLGGAQNWNGYLAQIGWTAGTKSSEIVSRPPQIGPDNRNQITIVPGNWSSLYGFNNPNGVVVGSTSSSAETTFITGGTYTEVLTFTLQASNTLQISTSIYTNNTSGTLLTSLTSTTTNAPVTNSFDAFSIGWRSVGNVTASTIDITSIQVVKFIQSQSLCISAAVSGTNMVVGQTNQSVSVTIPSGATASAPLSVDIVSATPGVAYPSTSVGGTFTVTFPQNSPYLTTNVPLTVASSGSTFIFITNATPPACISSNSSAAVTVSCGTVTLTPASTALALGQTNQTLQVSLTSGANQSSSVSVNISNANSSVATLPVSSVTFAQGGPSSTNIPITPVAVGSTSFSLYGLVGSCATLTGSTAVTVTCDPITINPASLISLVGQTSQVVTVSIPAFANQAGAVSVNLKSLNPTIAVPQGATGDTLALTFAQGATNNQTVLLNVLTNGTATLILTNASSAVGCSSTLTNATLVVTVPTADQTTNKIENFDTQAEASTNGWTDLRDQTNGENYGFSATANAGGTSGEAGGSFVRYTNRSYYADIQIGNLTLNDHISASGQLAINPPSSNATFTIGYFNTGDPNGNVDVLGFQLADGTYPQQRISAAVYTANALTVTANAREVFGPAMLEPPSVYYWSFTYDPTAGATGNGQLVLTYTDTLNVPEFSTNIDLTAANRAGGANFNAFGMLVRAINGLDTTDTMGIFIDNLTYTKNVSLAPAPIPLLVHANNGSVTLTWSNSVFSLEVATNVHGPYSKVAGAASPFVTNTTGAANFYRLIWP